MKSEYIINTIHNKKLIIDYSKFSEKRQFIAYLFIYFVISSIILVSLSTSGMIDWIDGVFRLPMLIVLIIIIRYLIQKLIIYITIKRNKGLEEGYNIKFYFGDNEIIVEHDDRKATMTYEMLGKVFENKEYFYLSVKVNKNMYYVIPKNSIDEDDKNNFKLFLESKISNISK